MRYTAIFTALTALLFASSAFAVEENIQYETVTSNKVKFDVGILYTETEDGIQLKVAAVSTGKGADFRRWAVADIRLDAAGDVIRPSSTEKTWGGEASFFRLPAALVFAAFGTQYERYGSECSSGQTCSVSGQSANSSDAHPGYKNSAARVIDKAGMSAGLGLLTSQAKGEIPVLRSYFILDRDLVAKSLSGELTVKIKAENKYKNDVRKADINISKQFADFVKKHPGVEHKAGVSSGGTLVIVSDDKAEKKEEGKAQSAYTTGAKKEAPKYFKGQVVTDNDLRGDEAYTREKLKTGEAQGVWGKHKVPDGMALPLDADAKKKEEERADLERALRKFSETHEPVDISGGKAPKDEKREYPGDKEENKKLLREEKLKKAGVVPDEGMAAEAAGEGVPPEKAPDANPMLKKNQDDYLRHSKRLKEIDPNSEEAKAIREALPKFEKEIKEMGGEVPKVPEGRPEAAEKAPAGAPKAAQGGTGTFISATNPETGETMTARKNADGSTTITKTDKDGRVIQEETTPAPSGRGEASGETIEPGTGAKVEAVKGRDGTTTVTKTYPDGSRTVTKKDRAGKVVAEKKEPPPSGTQKIAPVPAKKEAPAAKEKEAKVKAEGKAASGKEKAKTEEKKVWTPPAGAPKPGEAGGPEPPLYGPIPEEEEDAAVPPRPQFTPEEEAILKGFFKNGGFKPKRAVSGGEDENLMPPLEGLEDKDPNAQDEEPQEKRSDWGPDQEIM